MPSHFFLNRKRITSISSDKRVDLLGYFGEGHYSLSNTNCQKSQLIKSFLDEKNWFISDIRKLRICVDFLFSKNYENDFKNCELPAKKFNLDCNL